MSRTCEQNGKQTTTVTFLYSVIMTQGEKLKKSKIGRVSHRGKSGDESAKSSPASLTEQRPNESTPQYEARRADQKSMAWIAHYIPIIQTSEPDKRGKSLL